MYKLIAVLAFVFTAASQASAFDIEGNAINCSAHIHKTKVIFTEVPDGMDVKCHFKISKSVQNKIAQKAISVLVCNPLADAVEVAAAGPEDPVADALAIAVQVGCPMAIQQVVRQHNHCNGMSITSDVHATVTGGKGFNIGFAHCD